MPIQSRIPLACDIPLAIQVKEPLIMSRIMVTLAIDCGPIGRHPLQRHKKRFDGAPLNQNMCPRGKKRIKFGQWNGSQLAKSGCIFRSDWRRYKKQT
jgi:hypothetical protein